MKILALLLLAVGFVVLVVATVGWYASEQVIHPKQNPSPYTLKDYPLPIEKVYFQSRDGLRLVGWFVPGNSRATVVLAHGIESYKDWMLPHAYYLHEEGFSVLMFDFRHRGESEGDAQTLGAKESWDIHSAVDYLKTRPDVDPEHIGVQGVSLGAVSAILAAPEKPAIKGVVAQIPFTSVNDMLCHAFREKFRLPCFPFAYATKWISELRLDVDFDKVAPVEVIGRISPRPIFLIDEGKDALLPCDSVERLFNAAGDPKEFWIVPAAEHAKARETAPEEYKRHVVAFWRLTFGKSQPASSRDAGMESQSDTNTRGAQGPAGREPGPTSGGRYEGGGQDHE